jgi:hypothetical protein
MVNGIKFCTEKIFLIRNVFARKGVVFFAAIHEVTKNINASVLMGSIILVIDLKYYLISFAFAIRTLLKQQWPKSWFIFLPTKQAIVA